MPNTVKLHVWGDYACFTRPEFKVERISYDVMTPSAARGIFEAIHWKPAVLWVIEKIHVLRPIQWTSIQRNEVSEKVPVGNVRKAMNSGNIDGLRLIADRNRVQRSAMILRDVAYVIEAAPIMTRSAGDGDTVKKHEEIFRRRASKGQCYHRPCFGTREFPAEFDLVDDAMPETTLPEEQRSQDFGWMLLDLDYTRQGNITPKFFRAKMDMGAIPVPPMWSIEAMS